MTPEERAAYLANAEALILAAYVPSEPSSNGNGKGPEVAVYGPETRVGAALWDAETPGQLGATLRHIRTQAHASFVAPTGLLATYLARASGAIDHELRLPPIIGGGSPFSIFTVLAAGSGVGKSSTLAVARRGLPEANLSRLVALTDCAPIGSGEGLIEMMFDTVKNPDTKKNERVLARHNAFAVATEGLAIVEQGKRNGSTLMPTLCQLWMGERAGQQNASAETTRVLPDGSYAFGVVINIQTKYAAGLLDLEGLGLPQRCLFAPANDPDRPAERPAWPGPLTWIPPEPHQFDHLETERIGGWPHFYLTIDPTVLALLHEHRELGLAGHPVYADLDIHRDLMQLRIAGIFSMWDGARFHISEQYWALAGLVVAASSATRDVVARASTLDYQRIVATKAREAAVITEATTERQLDVVERRAIVSIKAELVATVVEHPGELTRAELRRHFSRKRRSTAAAALDELIAEGLIAEIEEPGERGQTRKRLHPRRG